MRVNALSFGTASMCESGRLGASYTLNLGVNAGVELSGGKRILFDGDSNLKSFARDAVKETLDFLGVTSGVRIKVESNIPVDVGLGEVEACVAASSAAVVGALAKRDGSINELRVDKFLGEQFMVVGDKIVDRGLLVGLCADVGGIRFDRLCSSVFGGFTVCDNLEKKVLRRGEMEDMTAVLVVGGGAGGIDYKDLFDGELEVVCNEALRGNLYASMNLNSLVYGDRALSAKLLGAGALAISSSGRTTVGLVRDERKVSSVVKSVGGEVLASKVINDGVRVLEKPKKVMRVGDFLEFKRRLTEKGD